MTNRYENDKLYAALIDTAMYNFGSTVFENLLDAVKKAAVENKTIATWDSDLKDFESPDLNQFWCMLVLMFGDYGTSPRVGWLAPSAELIQFLEDVVADLKELD